MNEYYGLCVTKEAPLFIIRIDRPEVQCRVNTQTASAISKAIEDANCDKEVKVIILTGTGEYFCGGGQINNYPDSPVVNMREYAYKFAEMHESMLKSGKPIIGAINGNAVAGGFSLADTCDLAVAGKSCKFGMPELEHGQFPMIAMATTAKHVPKKNLLEIVFTAKLVDAQKVLEWSLVNEIVEDDEVLDRAKELGCQIAKFSGAALAIGRNAYYEMNNMSLHEALNYSTSAMFPLLFTEDSKAWARAKKEGTTPVITNM